MFQCSLQHSNKTSMLLFLLLQVVLIVAVSAAHAEGDEGVTCHAGWDKTGVPREHVDEGECRAIVFIVCTLCSLCDFSSLVVHLKSINPIRSLITLLNSLQPSRRQRSQTN